MTFFLFFAFLGGGLSEDSTDNVFAFEIERKGEHVPKRSS